MSNTPSLLKNHSKIKKEGRERDKNRSVASESGGSSQCDTPPLIEKDGGSSQGKFAGISLDSVQCMAEQIGADMNSEAATNLAEDVSYKLRQMISSIALHSEMMKKTCVDSWDVNSAFRLADTSSVVGACSVHYAQVGEEKICCPVEELINVSEYSLASQTYVYSSLPTISVEWITDDKSLNNKSNISASLQNYYTKVARAILNLRKKPKELAVQDLMTNTRIGPIFPNLFNLAVLVLNDDNLNALNVPAKKPLQSNVLDMVDALCSNPCSLDTNIQQQFQRLFPVMVSNILGNGSLSEKMVAILTKITRTWPSFIAIVCVDVYRSASAIRVGRIDRLTSHLFLGAILMEEKEREIRIRTVRMRPNRTIRPYRQRRPTLMTSPELEICQSTGKGILFDYLSQGTKERLTAPMIKCVMALGRRALVECLAEHLDHLDDCIHRARRNHLHTDLRETILDASSCLLRSEPTTFLEDYVITDYTLYEMLGDSILPRRTIFPKTDKPHLNATNYDKTSEDDLYTPRLNLRRPKLRLIPSNPTHKQTDRQTVFEKTNFTCNKCLRIKIKNCRTLRVKRYQNKLTTASYVNQSRGVIVASGLLLRFKYKLNKPREPAPIYGALTL